MGYMTPEFITDELDTRPLWTGLQWALRREKCRNAARDYDAARTPEAVAARRAQAVEAARVQSAAWREEGLRQLAGMLAALEPMTGEEWNEMMEAMDER